MKELIYNNVSSKNILNEELILCHFSPTNEIEGLTREAIDGETTLNRPTANTYGTKYNGNLKFTVSFVKSSETVFTNSEQRKMAAILTSPKLPKWAKFIEDDSSTTLFRGRFTSITWKMTGIGIIGAECVFECDSPYSWDCFRETFYIDGSQTVSVNVDSDELEEYVYPIITLTANSTQEIKICNITDNEKTITVRTYDNASFIIDCRHCRISDPTTNGIVNFENLGWTDVDDIYWPRLIPGINRLKVQGTLELIITFYAPHKTAGGWL